MVAQRDARINLEITARGNAPAWLQGISKEALGLHRTLDVMTGQLNAVSQAAERAGNAIRGVRPGGAGANVPPAPALAPPAALQAGRAQGAQATAQAVLQPTARQGVDQPAPRTSPAGTPAAAAPQLAALGMEAVPAAIGESRAELRGMAADVDHVTGRVRLLHGALTEAAAALRALPSDPTAAGPSGVPPRRATGVLRGFGRWVSHNVLGLQHGGPAVPNGPRWDPTSTDKLPAMLSEGEFVVNRASAQANRPLLDRVNAARGPVSYRDLGGPITSLAAHDEAYRRAYAEAIRRDNARLKGYSPFGPEQGFNFAEWQKRRKLLDAHQKLTRDDFRSAASAAFPHADKVHFRRAAYGHSDNAYVHQGGRRISLRLNAATRGIYTEFSSGRLAKEKSSAKAEGGTRYDQVATELQGGTVDLLHGFRGLAGQALDKGLGIGYNLRDTQRRGRLYSKVLGGAGMTDTPGPYGLSHSWRGPRRYFDEGGAVTGGAVTELPSYHAFGGRISDERLPHYRALRRSILARQFGDSKTQRHALRLAMNSLRVEGALNAVPEGSTYIGSGVAGIAFKTPQGDVVRLQTSKALQLAQRSFGRSYDPAVFGTERPDIPEVLQPTYKESFGGTRGEQTLVERLPFAGGLGPERRHERAGMMRDLKKRIHERGYSWTDDHVGNVGMVGGEMKVIDPGGIHPMAAMPPGRRIRTDPIEQMLERMGSWFGRARRAIGLAQGGGVPAAAYAYGGAVDDALAGHYRALRRSVARGAAQTHADTPALAKHAQRLALHSLRSNQVLQSIPEGSQYLGSGIAGVAFRTPDGQVVRLQPGHAQRLADHLGGGRYPKRLFGTERPAIPGVLQPLEHRRYRAARGSVHFERLPYVQTLDAAQLSFEQKERILARAAQRLGKRGYELHDDHYGNLSSSGAVIDPGAIRRLPRAARTTARAYADGGVISGTVHEGHNQHLRTAPWAIPQGTDRIPARLPKDAFVVRAESARHNRDMLKALQRGANVPGGAHGLQEAMLSADEEVILPPASVRHRGLLERVNAARGPVSYRAQGGPVGYFAAGTPAIGATSSLVRGTVPVRVMNWPASMREHPLRPHAAGASGGGSSVGTAASAASAASGGNRMANAAGGMYVASQLWEQAKSYINSATTLGEIAQDTSLSGAQRSRMQAENAPVFGEIARMRVAWIDMIQGVNNRLREAAESHQVGTAREGVRQHFQPQIDQHQLQANVYRHRAAIFAGARTELPTAPTRRTTLAQQIGYQEAMTTLPSRDAEVRAGLEVRSAKAAEGEAANHVRTVEGRIARLQEDRRRLDRRLAGLDATESGAADTSRRRSTRAVDHLGRGDVGAAADSLAGLDNRRRVEINNVLLAQERTMRQLEHERNELVKAGLSYEQARQRTAQAEHQQRQQALQTARAQLGVLEQREARTRGAVTRLGGVNAGDRDVAIQAAQSFRENVNRFGARQALERTTPLDQQFIGMVVPRYLENIREQGGESIANMSGLRRMFPEEFGRGTLRQQQQETDVARERVREAPFQNEAQLAAEFGPGFERLVTVIRDAFDKASRDAEQRVRDALRLGHNARR